MIKLTESEWGVVKGQIDGNLATDIENRNIAASFKGEKIDITIKKTLMGGTELEAKTIGEKLNDFYCVTPLPGSMDGTFHRTRKALTHTASTLKCAAFKNRENAVKCFNLVKGLDINYKDVKELAASEDFNKFHKICVENKDY